MFCKIVYEFRYHDGRREPFEVIREFNYPAEAHIFADSDAAAAQKARKDEVAQVRVMSVAPVKTGKIWKVTMDGTAHLRNSEDKLVDREDMHKVLFVDALDMYDAEQVAYRIWERQVAEEGWSDISIFRTLVDVPKVSMTDREVA